MFLCVDGTGPADNFWKLVAGSADGAVWLGAAGALGSRSRSRPAEQYVEQPASDTSFLRFNPLAPTQIQILR